MFLFDKKYVLFISVLEDQGWFHGVGVTPNVNFELVKNDVGYRYIYIYIYKVSILFPSVLYYCQ